MPEADITINATMKIEFNAEPDGFLIIQTDSNGEEARIYVDETQFDEFVSAVASCTQAGK